MTDNQINTIGEKLKKHFNDIGITQEEAAKRLNVSQANISALLNKKPFGKKLAQKWGEEFGIQPSWLLTGEGEMLKPTEKEEATEIQEVMVPTSGNYKLVPLYNFDAVSGMNSYNNVTDTSIYIEKYIPFLDARDEDICIPITGNSMIPAYPPGSLVLLREVVMWREYFGYGHVFVLALKDGRRIIKEVRKSEENSKDNVLCVSYNVSSAPEDLPKSMIDRVYKVVRILTNEGY